MLFNSFFFWVFFLAVLSLYWRLSHRGQNLLLLVASYYFYGCWDWRFLGLIFATTTWDFFLARWIAATEAPGRRKALLVLAITVSLSVLGFFKYYGFFAQELATWMTSLGLTPLLPTLQIVLPVGISFMTFQSLSYTIDVYKREIQPARNFIDFALYIAFFPQLVAGPIERAKTLFPQVIKARKWQPQFFAEGLHDIVLGLFQKVVVGDNMAVLVNCVFATPTNELTGTEVLLGIYAFAFQIYGDFAGYSSMARGVARWLGFDLMLNFRNPYFAIDPSDFWRRWHISLSQWLRDYLYIPLGGNRGGALQTNRNLMLTMLLGGLWHGANWTFILWGALHGLLLCGYRAVVPTVPESQMTWAGRLGRMVLMFHLVCLGWLLFRAESISQAGAMLGQLVTTVGMTPLASTILGTMLLCAGPLMLYEAWVEWRGSKEALLDIHWMPRGLAYSYVALMCLFVPPPVAATFIYFQF